MIKADQIRSSEINTSHGLVTLSLERQDLSDIYPEMVRFTLTLSLAGRNLAEFRTNTYEYAPANPLDAESSANRQAKQWESELKSNPHFIEVLSGEKKPRCISGIATDMVIIQGSPRPDGNCSILAGWALGSARKLGKTAQIFFPDELDIHPCIGCYQCYNTGSCTFDDDMSGIIRAIQHASLLVICSPVYTSTVPGRLKILIDRCQAYHAERAIIGKGPRKNGLILSVAGRKGDSNFACVTRVLEDFMENLGIKPAGEILMDSMDQIHDVRNIPGVEDRVSHAVRACLSQEKL